MGDISRLPWFPFFYGDFLSVTGGLRSDQKWAAVALMGAMWSDPECSIPNDPDFIRVASGLGPKLYAKRIQPVLAMFVVEGGRLTHPALREQRQLAVEKSHRMIEIGRMGGKARAANARRCKARFDRPSIEHFPNDINETNQPPSQHIHTRESESK